MRKRVREKAVQEKNDTRWGDHMEHQNFVDVCKKKVEAASRSREGHETVETRLDKYSRAS